MKTLNFIKSLALSVAITAICTIVPATVHAQQDYKPYFANANWQFNAPFGNDFTNRASGWGMNFEGGYFVTPKLGLGLFLSYSSNHKYIDTQTMHPATNSALTTNQQRSLFQMPFGMAARFRFNPASTIFDPYVSMKLGAEYVQMSSYLSTYRIYDRNWGFYMSPEIGTNIWLSEQKNVGFNVSVYYSFATNKGHVLDGHINQLNNLGFRVGMAFYLLFLKLQWRAKCFWPAIFRFI